jgi:acyl carrier protein
LDRFTAMTEGPLTSSRADVERHILTIAGDLVSELGGITTSPRIDQSLEHDLGISSLERVELLLRLEQAFHVRLPDAGRLGQFLFTAYVVMLVVPTLLTLWGYLWIGPSGRRADRAVKT